MRVATVVLPEDRMVGVVRVDTSAARTWALERMEWRPRVVRLPRRLTRDLRVGDFQGADLRWESWKALKRRIGN